MNNEPKYIARRLGVFVAIALIIGLALSWNTTMIEIDLAMNPPVPQPTEITRIERLTDDAWDILAVRHDEEMGALLLTLTEVTPLDPDRFTRTIAELQRWLTLEYNGERYFVTEWVFKKQGKFVITTLTICNGLQSSVDLLTADCPTQPLDPPRIVPQKVWRRWWVEDYNPDFR